MKNWSIGADVALTPDSVINNPLIEISSGYLSSVKRSGAAKPFLKLDGCVIVPGLINGHDHLIGNYHPKVGNGPYPNWLPWDNDLKSSPVYRERQQIENRDLYLLAGYRNLVSGVTSVHDHIPHFVQEPFLSRMPVKVISRYTLAHSMGSAALNWGDIASEYSKAVAEDVPFVMHISEGFDDETRQNIQALDRLGALGDHSVLIHGIAFSKQDMQLIKQKKGSMVWCCDSNLFMFNATADIKSIIETGVNACIGTDSPMSGGENLLREIQVGRDYYRKHYGEVLPAKQVLRMVTENPARAFRLYENGRLAEDMLADLVVFNNSYDDPYESVANAELEDVRLVVINGLPVYGYADLLPELKGFDIRYQIVKLAGIDRFIIGDLLGVLKRIDKAVGFRKKFPFMPVEY